MYKYFLKLGSTSYQCQFLKQDSHSVVLFMRTYLDIETLLHASALALTYEKSPAQVFFFFFYRTCFIIDVRLLFLFLTFNEINKRIANTYNQIQVFNHTFITIITASSYLPSAPS